MAVQTTLGVNEVICRALGIDVETAVEVDIRLRPMEAPVVLVRSLVGYDADVGEFEHEIKRYELVERPEPAESKENTK